jgi:hypothetical protein
MLKQERYLILLESLTTKGWFGLWCLMLLSTIFQLYRGNQFYLMKETGVPGKNHCPAASHGQT